MRQHQHRDLWVLLVPGLLVVFTAAVIPVASAPVHGVWVPILLVVGGASGFLAIYILAALIWGLPLPGGFVGERVISNESDDDLGRECMTLSQSMWDLLADAKRNEPEYSTTSMPIGADNDTAHRHWQEATRKRQEHENRMLAQFIERFGTRLAGVLHALEKRGLLTQDEMRHLWWQMSTPTIHGLDEVPRVLGEKARELGFRP